MVENVSATETWRALRENPHAQIVDVRTEAEWTFVGVPDVTEAGKELALVPWQSYPSMQVNAAFFDRLREVGAVPESHLYFLCRSGARSTAAAQAAIGQGFPNAYNIIDGFEGPPDADGHRGTTAGWKAEGLPWRQR